MNAFRFAFTPLLDNEEDADEQDDQETEVFGKKNFSRLLVKFEFCFLIRWKIVKIPSKWEPKSQLVRNKKLKSQPSRMISSGSRKMCQRL